MITRINPDGVRQPGAGSCLVTEVERLGLIFVSGQIGVDASGRLAGTSVADQLRQIYGNFDAILAALDLDRSAFVSRTVYVTDLEEASDPEVLSLVREYFERYPCPSTLLEVGGLVTPDIKIEIDAVLARA